MVDPRDAVIRRLQNLEVERQSLIRSLNTKEEEKEAPEMDEEPADPWQHRSTGMLCATCMWYVSKDKNKGRCRRHAPTLGGWPVVFTIDWCGDHKLA